MGATRDATCACSWPQPSAQRVGRRDAGRRPPAVHSRARGVALRTVSIVDDPALPRGWCHDRVVARVLSAELLTALRERRARRPPSVVAWPPPRRPFLDALRTLLRTPAADTARIAADFVQAMHALQTEVERDYDAFLLDMGMGPMAYLAADGRVLLDERTWDGDGVREADDDEAIGVLRVGAQKTGVALLLDLIPPMPADGAACPRCGGRGVAEPMPGFGHELLCFVCGGRGWALPRMIEAAVAGGWLPR